MGFARGPKIVTDGIVLALDAASSRCVAPYGTEYTLTDITGITTGLSLQGAIPTGGHFYFQGQGETDGSPTGDYIEVPAATTQVQAYPLGVSYEIWLNPNASRRMSLFFGAGTINHIEAYTGTSGGNFRTEARLQNGYSFGASAPPGGIPLNTWSHLVIAWDAHAATRAVRWYWNGSLFHTHANFYSGTNGTSEDFWFTGIGRATGSAAYLYATSWSGYLNGIKVYSKTLSATDVAQNYNAQKSRYGL